MRVICTLPNCSSPINGYAFESTPLGWVSEELSAEQVAAFTAIPGYAAYPSSGPPRAVAGLTGAADEAADLLAPTATPPDTSAPARRTRPRTPR